MQRHLRAGVKREDEVLSSTVFGTLSLELCGARIDDEAAGGAAGRLDSMMSDSIAVVINAMRCSRHVNRGLLQLAHSRPRFYFAASARRLRPLIK